MLLSIGHSCLEIAPPVLTGFMAIPIFNIMTMFFSTKATWNYNRYDCAMKLIISFILFMLHASIGYTYIGYSSLYYDINSFERYFIIPRGDLPTYLICNNLSI